MPLDRSEEIVYDRPFNRLYLAAKEFHDMGGVGDYSIDVVDIVKKAIDGIKTTAKKLR
jgi:hypothetical protein